MKFKLLFIFTLFFSSLPLCAMDQKKLDEKLAEVVKAGNIRQAQICLALGTNPNTITGRDVFGVKLPAPLIIVAESGSIEMVRLLLKYHADINVKDYHARTALMHAAKNGHTEIVKLLLENDADINSEDNQKQTAFMHAAQKGHFTIVQLLLDHANINAINTYGETALILAVEEGHTEIVKLLLKNHADVNIAGWREVTPLIYAEESFDEASRYKNTALMRAAENGSDEIVELLLKYGAHVDTVGSWGKTALHRAAERGHAKIVRLFLKSNANINIADCWKRSPLITVATKGHADLVNMFLKFDNQDKNKTEKAYKTASTILADDVLYADHPKVVECILFWINKTLDVINDTKTCNMMDQYILNALNKIVAPHWYSDQIQIPAIETINAFRMFLHHADKLLLSTKMLESLIAKSLGQRESGEETFRKTIKHLRTHAF